MGQSDTTAWLNALRGASQGAEVSVSASVRAAHGRDPAHPEGAAPEAVAFPTTTAQVQALVAVCAAHGKPVTAYGAGTSLEGHVQALRGGLCLDMSGMNRILAVRPLDGDVTVEAGVTREALNLALRDQGVFFPIDPGANATIGGMASTRASGTTTVRYGTMRAAVLGLRVVTASGEVVQTGGRARKSAAGYDLTALFVGAEGTLGIITEVTLRVHPIPEQIAAAVVCFHELCNAVDAVSATLHSGVVPARIELLDALQMKAVNQRSRLGLPELTTLFLEFHGTEAGVEEDVRRVQEVMAAFGGTDFEFARDTQARARLWRARHEAFWAAKDMRPGAEVLTTDVCVPLSRLSECILQTRADFDARGLTAPILGHVGDGNFHALILFDPHDPAERAHADAAAEALVLRALEMGGTCTGEHGVGLGKRAYLEREHGPGVGVMRAVKQALDPQALFNPGKLFFEPTSEPKGLA